MQSLRFTFDVRHPFRGLEGGIMELSAIAQGNGAPAPHAPKGQTSEGLRQALLDLPPPPQGGGSSSITDRITRAHRKAREILKTAAQITDVYFLYTPAQIWLAAFLTIDRPLAEFYLYSKFPSPSPQSDDNNNNPILALQQKLHQTLSSCSDILRSHEPLSTNTTQMQNLKRIAKKLYRCQNPEKVNNHNNNPATSASATGDESGGGIDADKADRAVKKRRLEQQR